MTEVEWFNCTDPAKVVAKVSNSFSARQHRLIACGWLRLHWDAIEDERSRRAVEVAEAYSDGKATDEARQMAFDDAWRATTGRQHGSHESMEAAMLADSCVNQDFTAWLNASEAAHHEDLEYVLQAQLVRE